MTIGLDPMQVRHLVGAFLAEDAGRGDVTTAITVPPGARVRARIEAREEFVIAGLDVARMCFEEAAGADPPQWDAFVADGAAVLAGAPLATVSGAAGAIFAAERSALNLLSRLSGVATLTRAFVERIEGTGVRIVDTRKTTPGLRLFEKYAVRVGGGFNHRFGLDDGILIKDNHLAVAGGVTEAVGRARSAAPHGLKVQVEVATLEELDAAVAAGADAVLLDNMEPSMVREAVLRAGGKVVLEVSGGIDLENVGDYAPAGIDLISVGALTHSASAADVALEVEVA